MEKVKRKRIQYVDGERFLNALVDYKKAVKAAKKADLDKPQIPTYLGECFLKIAEHLSCSPSFSRYSYRDEMISDGVENCLMYFENFNPNTISQSKKGNNFGKKTKGPFPYFTQIIYHAFCRRIAKEKKQQYIKAKSVTQSDVLNELMANVDDDVVSVYGYSTKRELYDNLSEFISKFEDNLKEKKAKKLKKEMG